MEKTISFKQIGVRSFPLFSLSSEGYFALEGALLDVAPEDMEAAYISGCPSCPHRYLAVEPFRNALETVPRALSDSWTLEKMVLKRKPHLYARVCLGKKVSIDGRKIKQFCLDINHWLDSAKNSPLGRCHSIRTSEQPAECKHEEWPKSDKDLYG
jgi:hypothetical protein